ncbi:uncharacterized protein EDB93DRAFT_826087 [Suillus bovinus]|uniref:uncharacterized protein n=1 Tax=Suillus bovinus TaxID=48563 RepID=UPI001B85F39A|nr:uncharacterized protein EDB93DRAFT_826087 [Suillus bovinus]KAG2135374.1 hypothetical protein EDB93DRAFT_826087 [Suillus bovinus]
MLCSGEVIGKLETSWNELLDHSGELFDLSFTLKVAVAYPCNNRNGALSYSLLDYEIARDTDACHAQFATYMTNENISHPIHAMQHLRSVLYCVQSVIQTMQRLYQPRVGLSVFISNVHQNSCVLDLFAVLEHLNTTGGAELAKLKYSRLPAIPWILHTSSSTTRVLLHARRSLINPGWLLSIMLAMTNLCIVLLVSANLRTNKGHLVYGDMIIYSLPIAVIPVKHSQFNTNYSYL